MRSFLAYWSRQLFDAICRVPPWTPLPHRRRGRAAGRLRTLTLVPCGRGPSSNGAESSAKPSSFVDSSQCPHTPPVTRKNKNNGLYKSGALLLLAP